MTDQQDEIDYDDKSEKNDDSVSEVVEHANQLGTEELPPNAVKRKDGRAGIAVNGIIPNVLFISRFGKDTKVHDVAELMVKFGPTSDITVREKLAFVDFVNAADAAKAKEELHYHPGLGSDSLIVDFKKDKPKRKVYEYREPNRTSNRDHKDSENTFHDDRRRPASGSSSWETRESRDGRPNDRSPRDYSDRHHQSGDDRHHSHRSSDDRKGDVSESRSSSSFQQQFQTHSSQPSSGSGPYGERDRDRGRSDRDKDSHHQNSHHDDYSSRRGTTGADGYHSHNNHHSASSSSSSPRPSYSQQEDSRQSSSRSYRDESPRGSYDGNSHHHNVGMVQSGAASFVAPIGSGYVYSTNSGGYSGSTRGGYEVPMNNMAPSGHHEIPVYVTPQALPVVPSRRSRSRSRDRSGNTFQQQPMASRGGGGGYNVMPNNVSMSGGQGQYQQGLVMPQQVMMSNSHYSDHNSRMTSVSAVPAYGNMHGSNSSAPSAVSGSYRDEFRRDVRENVANVPMQQHQQQQQYGGYSGSSSRSGGDSSHHHHSRGNDHHQQQQQQFSTSGFVESANNNSYSNEPSGYTKRQRF